MNNASTQKRQNIEDNFKQDKWRKSGKKGGIPQPEKGIPKNCKINEDRGVASESLKDRTQSEAAKQYPIKEAFLEKNCDAKRVAVWESPNGLYVVAYWGLKGATSVMLWKHYQMWSGQI